MVCMGNKCRATFSDAVFNRCSLVVVGRAQVTLHSPQFKDMKNSRVGLSVYVHGSGSCVQIKGGAIEGGIQGVTVQAAARLEASDLTVIGMQYAGMEVCGAGSVLTAAGGAVCDMLSVDAVDERFVDYGDLADQHGVHVHTEGCAQLSSMTVSGARTGVGAYSGATARLDGCTVSHGHSVAECVVVRGGSTARLDNSTLSHGGCGLDVHDALTHVTATSCQLLHNTNGDGDGDGAAVYSDATLTLHGCTSAHNDNGYYCKGGKLEMASCTSDGDIHGLFVNEGHLTASQMSVTKSQRAGIYVAGGKADLKSCSATSCGGAGMLLCSGSKSSVEHCTLVRNKFAGIVASSDAAVAVRRCDSRENGGRGYLAQGGAQMAVVQSCSAGDEAGCVVAGPGKSKLTMEHVSVDGVVKSCTLLFESGGSQ